MRDNEVVIRSDSPQNIFMFSTAPLCEEKFEKGKAPFSIPLRQCGTTDPKGKPLNVGRGFN